MIEQAGEAVNALRMLENCKKNHTACSDCPQYYFGGKIACHPIEYVYGRLADLIEAIAAELEQVTQERDEAWKVVESVSEQNEIMAGALERVKRERNAAVEDISKECHKCKHFKVLFNGCTPDYDCDYSDVCRDDDHWQWRGVKED